jgi:hypothetical protein
MGEGERAVIAAVRLALAGGGSAANTLAVVELLVEQASPTDPDDRSGLALFCDLLATRRLRAEVVSGDGERGGQ